MELTIGKYTLESLTTGMYLDPLVLYREYIQNAIDSIDEAIEKRFLLDGSGKILIRLDKHEQRITIEDNGSGIPSWQARKVLLDIGNSRKSYSKSRGFRGIGRLVGLSYSTSLIFQTSFYGEDTATEICFDSTKLSDLLMPGRQDELDLPGVISEVTTHKKYSESPDSHYFRIILNGVYQDELLDEELVNKYIGETAPAPYDPDVFSWGPKIRAGFTKNGLTLDEYAIFIQSSDTEYRQIYKPFRDQFLADKQKKLLDTIEDIELLEIRGEATKLLALVWYSKTKLLGGILNDSFKGLRFRKGNILIGDRSTLNCLFKEERFNGWYQGEIFVLDQNIIPNSRRDNFERNNYYSNLLQELGELGNKLSKQIRLTSAERMRIRNTSLINHDSDDFNDDYASDQLETASSLQSTQNILKQFQLLRQTQTSLTKYSALNVSMKLTQSEKKTLEKVFDIILRENKNDSGLKLIETIVERLSIL